VPRKCSSRGKCSGPHVALRGSSCSFSILHTRSAYVYQSLINKAKSVRAARPSLGLPDHVDVGAPLPAAVALNTHAVALERGYLRRGRGAVS
jgi:hypothetical protein